jgi:hypothetical protein
MVVVNHLILKKIGLLQFLDSMLAHGGKKRGGASKCVAICTHKRVY